MARGDGPVSYTHLLGLSKTQYGLVMFVNSLAYITGTFVCRHWLPRFGVRRAVALGGALSLSGGTLLGVLSLLGVVSVWTIMLPQLLYLSLIHI